MSVLRIPRRLGAPGGWAVWAAWSFLAVAVRPLAADSPSVASPVPLAPGITLSVPSTVGAGFPKPVGDVALGRGGVLQGEVVCGGNRASDGTVAGLPVAVLRGGRTVAATRTDAYGRFAFRDLTGGLHRVLIDAGDGPFLWFFRAWTPEGAPPRAASRLNFVLDRRLIRGQSPIPGTSLPHAAAITAIAAGAIATPIIYHNVKRDGHIPASP